MHTTSPALCPPPHRKGHRPGDGVELRPKLDAVEVPGEGRVVVRQQFGVEDQALLHHDAVVGGEEVGHELGHHRLQRAERQRLAGEQQREHCADERGEGRMRGWGMGSDGVEVWDVVRGVCVRKSTAVARERGGGEGGGCSEGPHCTVSPAPCCTIDARLSLAGVAYPSCRIVSPIKRGGGDYVWASFPKGKISPPMQIPQLITLPHAHNALPKPA